MSLGRKNVSMSDEDLFQFVTPPSTGYPSELPPNTEVIFVNTLNPSMNREVTKIYPIQNVEGVSLRSKNAWYYGFAIVIRVQVQYILDTVGNPLANDAYILRKHSDNTCLLTYPSTDYVFANNREEIASAQDDCLTDALDDELWTIHQNKTPDVSNPVPKTKNLLLVFPENVVIEWEDVVNRSLVNDENEFPGLSLTVSETHPNASGRSVGHFVYWKIGRSDIRMAKKGPVQQMRKNRLGFQFGFAGNEPSEGGGAATDMAMS
ncbi:hypothetical protein IV203_026746 [Nitzschia inconspicua]|uniref:Uncharacterized protein n=1 Tax=Nitzschia inconspicua TaxID=303405 RepID=A0A9K3LKP3_9STRA|nr:hypothetical protein IV203_026738 [Nitzschia inconspicua]KAG7363386.1 hypothetical protein IV203_026746 [Nitzschia inconspicua]